MTNSLVVLIVPLAFTSSICPKLESIVEEIIKVLINCIFVTIIKVCSPWSLLNILHGPIESIIILSANVSTI